MSSAGDTLRLTATNDTLDLTGIAVGGIELIEAGAGNDNVTGSASGDVISGGAGDDVLAGGAGDDTFNVLGGAEGFDVVLGGAGFDRIQASPYNDVIGLVRLTGVEAIDGGAGSDTIRLTAGNDALDLTGVTVSGIELVDAGGGDDVIAASAAADVLKGGLGNDTFVFAPGFGNDAIADFQLGTASQPVADVIDLSALGLQSFAELQGHMTQLGADTIIAIDAETSLRLAGISLSQLQGNDFIL